MHDIDLVIVADSLERGDDIEVSRVIELLRFAYVEIKGYRSHNLILLESETELMGRL